MKTIISYTARTLHAVALSLVLLGGAAMAQNQNIVLTPTALYDLIERQNVKTTKLTHVCLKLNQRVNELEAKVVQLKKREDGIVARAELAKKDQAKVTSAITRRVYLLEGHSDPVRNP